MGSRAGRVIALVILAIALGGFAALLAIDSRLPTLSNQDPLEGWAFMIAFFGCAITGAVVLRVHPRHPIGWMIAAIGVIPLAAVPLERWGTHRMLTHGSPDLATTMGFWLNSWYWYVLLALALVFLPLLFPTGRLPSERWRWPAAVPMLAVAAICIMGMLQPRIGSQEERSITIANPAGVAGMPHPEGSALGGILFGGLLLGMVLAVTAIVVRYRRSRGTERQQMRWFFLPVLLLPMPFLFEQVAAPDLVIALAMPLTITSFPVAIAIAITRYRLYDLGRLVSRTVTYVVVVGVLVSLYAGAVLLLGAASRGLAGEQGEAVVAVSTLLVAAAFQPLRKGVHAVVDRRFNRSRYDAARTVEAFGTRLRDEVDLDALRSELLGATTGALEPSHGSLWLAEQRS